MVFLTSLHEPQQQPVQKKGYSWPNTAYKMAVEGIIFWALISSQLQYIIIIPSHETLVDGIL